MTLVFTLITTNCLNTEQQNLAHAGDGNRLLYKTMDRFLVNRVFRWCQGLVKFGEWSNNCCLC